MTLNPDIIWSKIYAALATNSGTKITDPNKTRDDPTLSIFSSFPDYSANQRYPIFIIEPPVLTESGYSINSPTKVVTGTVSIQTFALSSANLKSGINTIKDGVRSSMSYLETQGVKLVFSPDETIFDDDTPDSWLEEGKKIHFQSFSFNIKSSGVGGLVYTEGSEYINVIDDDTETILFKYRKSDGQIMVKAGIDTDAW